MVQLRRLLAGIWLAAALLHAQPAEAYLQDGLIQLRAGNFKQAEAAFRRSYELDNGARSLDGLADALLGQGRNKEAVDVVAAEVEKYPKRKALRLSLGNTAVRAGIYDVAITQFETLIKDTVDPPQLANLYNTLAEAYRRKGDTQQAIATLRKGKEVAPWSTQVVAALAVVLDSAGEKQEAAANYRAVLAMDPNQAIAMNNLAFLIASQNGDLDEAMGMAQKARQLLPKLDEVADTLGSIYLKKKDMEKAVELFREVVQRNPGRADYRKNLAGALDQRGDNSPEIQELKAALRSEPSPESEKKILALLPAIGK